MPNIKGRVILNNIIGTSNTNTADINIDVDVDVEAEVDVDLDVDVDVQITDVWGLTVVLESETAALKPKTAVWDSVMAVSDSVFILLYFGSSNHSGSPQSANGCRPSKITANGKCGTVDDYGYTSNSMSCRQDTCVF